MSWFSLIGFPEGMYVVAQAINPCITAAVQLDEDPYRAQMAIESRLGICAVAARLARYAGSVDVGKIPSARIFGTAT